MADAKQLKFQFVLDETSFQRVKRAIKELTDEMSKLGKQMSGGGGILSGGNVGRPPSAAGSAVLNNKNQTTQIGSAILKDVDAFQKFAKSGSTAMGAMTEAVRKGIRDQEGELKRLDSIMDKINGKYNLMNEKQAGIAQKRMLGLQGKRNEMESNLSQLQNAERGLNPAATGANAAPAPGGLFSKQLFGQGTFFGGQAGGGPFGMPLGPSNLMGVLRMVGLVAGGANAIVGTSIGVNNMAGNLAAQRGAVMQPMMNRVMGADVSDQMKMRAIGKMSQDDRMQMLKRSGMSDVAAKDLVGAVGTSFKDGVLGNASGEALTGTAFDTRTMERQQEMMDAYSKSGDWYMNYGRAIEYAANTRGSRKLGSRILGVGFNRHKDQPQNIANTFTDLQAKLHEQGYSVEELASATSAARLGAGRQFASRFAGAGMAAGAAGYGGYADVLAGAARVGGLANTDMLARGALGGKIDTAAGIQMGQSLFQYDPRGTTNGLGMMLAAQGGMGFTGGPQDFNLVQRMGLGSNLLSSITTGGMSPYQQGRNLIGAIGANPGGTTYAQDYMGNGMSFKQMVDIAADPSQMTATGRALGLTAGGIKKQLSGSVSSVMDLFVDQGGSDPMSRAVKGYRSSGKGLDEYLQGLKGTKGGAADIEAIGAYFGMVSGQGEEAGLGAVGLLAGMDNKKLKLGKGPGGRVDDVEREQLKAEADQMRESAKAMAGAFEDLMKSFQGNKKFGDTMSSFAQLGTSIDHVIEEFDKLAGVTPEVRKKISESGIVGQTIKALKAEPPRESGKSARGTAD